MVYALFRQRAASDDRADRFMQAVKYYYRETLEGFLQRDCTKLLHCLLCIYTLFFVFITELFLLASEGLAALPRGNQGLLMVKTRMEDAQVSLG